MIAGKIEEYAQGRKLDLARGSLVRCRVDLGLTLARGGSGQGPDRFKSALDHADKAIDYFERSSQENELPRGLLTRAMIHRLTKKFVEADNDIRAARELAERGSMKLHLIDCDLERCRLLIACGEKDEARQKLARAEELDPKLEYGRRKAELKQLHEILNT
jgi:tetratricopeptide (TPR) repeat protein